MTTTQRTRTVRRSSRAGPYHEARCCAIYCRISQVPKAEIEELAEKLGTRDRRELFAVASSLGVARQEKACRRIAAEKGWDVVEVFVDDDCSGFSGKPRKDYLRMVEAIKAGDVNAIVAWSPSRLTRHPRELEDLIDLLDAHRIEVATHIAGDYDLSTSGGRMVARVVGAAARHESEEKSERAKMKAEENAGAGRFHGGQRPYGYAKDGVTIIEEEAEVIRFMARRVGEGLGLRRLEAELNEAGYPTMNGGPWYFSAAKQILTNPRIAGVRATRVKGPDGVRRYEIVTEAAEWPAIIDRATWQELQAILTDPRRKQERPARYLLSGLVVTDQGEKMTGARSKGPDGSNRRRIYKGPGVSIDADQLEAFVVKYVLAKTDKAALPRSKKASRVPSEVAALERELEELAQLRGEGTISLREWMAAKKPLDERLETARSKVPAGPAVPAGVTAVLGRKGGLRQAWPEMSDDEQRRALAAVLERVEVESIGPDGRAFHTDRIHPILRRTSV